MIERTNHGLIMAVDNNNYFSATLNIYSCWDVAEYSALEKNVESYKDYLQEGTGKSYELVAGHLKELLLDADLDTSDPAEDESTLDKYIKNASLSETITDVYRLYNKNSGEHFYTESSAEKDYLKKVGWIDEGIGWTAPKESKTPVYRLYNPNAGDHHYTLNKNEKDTLVRIGWRDEGISWYSDDKKSVPVYRQYNPNAKAGAHNYTRNKGENDSLVKAGWRAEGTGWYGVNVGSLIASELEAHFYTGTDRSGKLAAALYVTNKSDIDADICVQFGLKDKPDVTNYDQNVLLCVASGQSALFVTSFENNASRSEDCQWKYETISECKYSSGYRNVAFTGTINANENGVDVDMKSPSGFESNSGNPKHVYYDATWPEAIYLKDGKIVGIDLEYDSSELMSDTTYQFRFEESDLSFDDIIYGMNVVTMRQHPTRTIFFR